MYNYANKDQPSTLSTVTRNAPATFDLEDFSDFYLYPGKDGSVTTTLTGNTTMLTETTFRHPFSGDHATVTQVASSSSATSGNYAGSVPSVFAQSTSVSLAGISATVPAGPQQDQAKLQVLGLTNFLYATGVADGYAVCTQWPEPCGDSDGRFIDGSFTDGATLALNVAEYQASEGGDLEKTMKVLLTDQNYVTDSPSNILSYFQTTFNEGVPPGGFVWPPSVGANAVAAKNPRRSAQIFEDYLDTQMIDSAMMPIEGTQMTYAYINATTIDNPAYGTIAGQHVEILLIQTNSDIPTFILGTTATEEYMKPVAELAESIAGNEDLLSIVEDFVAGE